MEAMKSDKTEESVKRQQNLTAEREKKNKHFRFNNRHIFYYTLLHTYMHIYIHIIYYSYVYITHLPT